MLFIKKILIFLSFSSFLVANSNQSNRYFKNKKLLDKAITDKKNKKQVTDKKIRGYFGTKTSFTDKDGKPKLLNKDFKSLTFEELEHNRNVHLEKNIDKEALIRYTERMIALCKDPIRISNLRLEVADLYFSIDRFDKAYVFYNEFVKLYPGNKEAEFAAYRALFSKYQETLPSDKDQSTTKETLQMAKSFLSNESYKNHKNEVNQIIKRCKKKLVDYELNIFNFYLDKNKIIPAEKRLENIEKELLTDSKEDQFLKEELKKQIQAKKDKTTYIPKYEIISNSSIYDYFLKDKNKKIEVDEIPRKIQGYSSNFEKNKSEIKRKIDYVSKF